MAVEIEDSHVREYNYPYNYNNNYYRVINLANMDIRAGYFIYLSPEEGKNIRSQKSRRSRPWSFWILRSHYPCFYHTT